MRQIRSEELNQRRPAVVATFDEEHWHDAPDGLPDDVGRVIEGDQEALLDVLQSLVRELRVFLLHLRLETEASDLSHLIRDLLILMHGHDKSEISWVIIV